MSTFMPGMAQKLNVKLDSTERLGRTLSIWIRYHEHIQIVRDFIPAAGNDGSWPQPIRQSKPLHPTTVHQFDGQTKTFFISNKHHTVKFSSHDWLAYGLTYQSNEL